LSSPHLEASPATSFRDCSSRAPHQSSSNLHQYYFAKSQFTPHCQSVITQGSDYPPVLEPHKVFNMVEQVPRRLRRLSKGHSDIAPMCGAISMLRS
jgi:hypothetical protein